MDSIILPTAFDVSKVTLGAVKTLDNGGKTVYVSYDGKPMILQTPEMVAPFGLSKFETDKGVPKYSIDLSFKDREKRKGLQAFYDNMLKLNDVMIQQGLENSMSWFRKKHNTTDVVEALFNPTIKFPKDKMTGEITDKYPPTFKISLPVNKEGQFTCDVYNNNCELIDLKDIDVKGANVTAIIRCMGVWLAGGKFGITWKVVQLRVVQSNVIKGFAFKDIEDDKIVDEDFTGDNESVHTDSAPDVIPDSDAEDESVNSPVKAVAEEPQNDDDEEDDIEKPVVKKTVRRKTVAK